jgi:hypothetical protein
VEIQLQSSVDYENPYTATEIDATFTHADGTVITLPGFWMEADTWAVRFSPTKVGEWTYKITCKDASNQGLFETGKILATESTGDTEIADILIYSDGEGEPTPDIFVATNIPADDPEPETTEVTEAATDVVTGTVTDAPADSAVESTGDTPSEKTGCTSVLNGMTLAVVTVAGAVVCAHRRKEN